MDISNQIKTRREAMGLSQEQLAEKLYVSRQTISNWEREIGTNFGEDILRMYGNIDIEKAKEYQDIVEEYYPIETIVYGIKNIKQEFIENGRKEIYKRTYKD